GGDWNTASGQYATVGGGWSNTASELCAAVAGGYLNTASGQLAAVGGGYLNTAINTCPTVAGGYGNAASQSCATVAGGYKNAASEWCATVAGGQNNTASFTYATVGGGHTNAACGQYATVPGGSSNTARADYSFAAGRRAKANNAGSFAWADSTNADFNVSNNNRFGVRASGGVYLYTNSSLTAGSYLAAGSGSWTSVSDRAMKENVAPVNAADVLEKVAVMPISAWNYKTEDRSIRHIGPMAQDFHAAFGLGDSDKAITTIDADGVALAAIQALHKLVREKEARITTLEADKMSQQQRIANLEARLAALESRRRTTMNDE
ncbi:tail fiber domain-containing protein, partial [Candidatus Sumerlaeota bacterium]|nr:tail fiber domain-containing protein [Candidatus Sumerlaeota bacterium]